MIGDVVKTLRREQCLLLGEMGCDGGGALKGFGHGEAVVKTPEKVRCDGLIERIHVAPEQRAGEALEQLISLVG